MAAALGVGGDGGVSVVLRERAEKGWEEYRGSEKGQGLRGVADSVQGDEGKAASRRWPGRRWRSPRLASVLLAREEDDRGKKAAVGWAVLGRLGAPGKWLGCWWATR